jgi:hypothetical protein
MANRYQTNQHKAVYPLIAERDGEYCLACFCETGQKRGPGSVKLEIDHADGNRYNWSPSNLHLLCKTHNLKYRSLSVRQHAALMATYSAKNERVCVRENRYLGATRRGGLYQQGSPEMKINSMAEINWLEFMTAWITEHGSISKEDAVNAGAIAADDVSVQTTARYLTKHISILGRFKEIKDSGTKRVVFRQDTKITVYGNGHNGNKGNLKKTAPIAGVEVKQVKEKLNR